MYVTHQGQNVTHPVTHMLHKSVTHIFINFLEKNNKKTCKRPESSSFLHVSFTFFLVAGIGCSGSKNQRVEDFVYGVLFLVFLVRI